MHIYTRGIYLNKEEELILSLKLLLPLFHQVNACISSNGIHQIDLVIHLGTEPKKEINDRQNKNHSKLRN